MDYRLFHWIWYLIGFIFAPKLTIAIVLSIHGKSLGLPLWVMILIWIIVLFPETETKEE